MDTDVQPARASRAVWFRSEPREERVGGVQRSGREQCHVVPGVEGPNLFLVTADCGRRTDDLRAAWNAVSLIGAQLLDDCFVETDQRTERPRDQMEFVLD